MKRKAKVLFGAVDIGWRIEQYSQFLKNRYGEKIQISSFVKHKVNTSQYKTAYDFHVQYENINPVLRWLHSFGFFIFALFRFNTFYFFSGETLLTRKLRPIEFKIYQLLGKRIIMHFVGSDIRDPHFLFWKSDHLIDFINGKAKVPELSSNWQKRLIADSLKHANSILVSTPDLLSIVPSAIYYPVMIDANKFLSELNSINKDVEPFFKSKKVKILHAPSNVKLKGSEYINQLLKELEKEDDRFEFIYTRELNKETGSTYTVSRYDLFQLYAEADIVIDQLVIGWYGLQAIEALLANCLCVAYIEDEFKEYLDPLCPIINANANNLKKVIKSLIDQFLTSVQNLELQKEWAIHEHNIRLKNAPLCQAIFGD